MSCFKIYGQKPKYNFIFLASRLRCEHIDQDFFFFGAHFGNDLFIVSCLSCPFAYTGTTCETKNDPNNCTSQRPPLQPCSGTCVSKETICSGNQTCNYPDKQIKYNCKGKVE